MIPKKKIRNTYRVSYIVMKIDKQQSNSLNFDEFQTANATRKALVLINTYVLKLYMFKME